ncbi:MAG: hypothetical protein MK515_02980 [SAR324 cluster bacterium]|jgi:hypothetical protein|nr:hypothetical protein [SAR324 cluster bacterium]|tara:strand:+ start:558 stop:1424 length:867 start_codon:yes stop_codon:yes gene_type:complete
MQNRIGIFVENAKEHTTDVRKKMNSRTIFIFSIFFSVFLLHGMSVSAQESYLSELLPGTKISYKHWVEQRSEITGHSNFIYEILTRDGTRFIVEKNENTKADGEVFTRKSLWFDANSGVPRWYEEEDLREDFRITNTYSGQILRTRLNKAGKILEFETDLSEENAVPFEVVIFFLRKNLQQILQTKEFSFTLFLPLLAIELEEKGLPRSMSMIRMKVEPQEEVQLDTPLGSMKAHKILILPQSGFLRAILPREKTHFEFSIAEAAPHYLLQFVAGKTRHILTQLSPAE